jgi:hypothetical protein
MAVVVISSASFIVTDSHIEESGRRKRGKNEEVLNGVGVQYTGHPNGGAAKWTSWLIIDNRESG